MEETWKAKEHKIKEKLVFHGLQWQQTPERCFVIGSGNYRLRNANIREWNREASGRSPPKESRQWCTGVSLKPKVPCHRSGGKHFWYVVCVQIHLRHAVIILCLKLYFYRYNVNGTIILMHKMYWNFTYIYNFMNSINVKFYKFIRLINYYNDFAHFQHFFVNCRNIKRLRFMYCIGTCPPSCYAPPSFPSAQQCLQS